MAFQGAVPLSAADAGCTSHPAKRGSVHPPDPRYAASLDECLRLWADLSRHTKKETLLPALTAALAAYPQDSLTRMMANFGKKTADMQKRYPNRLLAAVHREIFDTHHRLMTMAGKPPALWRVPRVREGFAAYCTMAAAACRAQAAGKDPALLCPFCPRPPVRGRPPHPRPRREEEGGAEGVHQELFHQF